MINNYPFLTILILLPIIGALFIILFVKQDSKFANQNATIMAFWTSMVNFLVSIIVLCKFNFADAGYQFVEKHVWISYFNIGYHVGIDGISLSLILLTTFLLPICILCSKHSIKHRVKEYFIYFLLLESFIIASFAALDLVLFYIFFELILIPMFLIIGIWGGSNKIYASLKFFLYTFFGSVLFLLAIIFIILTTKTSNLIILYNIVPDLFTLPVQKVLWLGFFAAFAVKIPMWPVHSWLPDAHVQAPTAGSVILAAILLKLGAYGFIRFSIGLLPEASFYFKEYIYVLSIVAIIYTSIIAFAQTDIKKLVAYSSIAHMGFVTLGIFSFNEQGMSGAIFQMISHGLVSGALFAAIGMIYERVHSRNIADLNGLAAKMPNYTILFMVVVLGSIALPATSGFVGEFLILLAAYKVSPSLMILAAIGVVLGAVYMLYLVKKVIMGEVVNQNIHNIKDISIRELIILSPFVILIILLGIYPAIIFNLIENNVEHLLNSFYLSVNNY
jgi:NADH-quinone oxidoreductase subunit M